MRSWRGRANRAVLVGVAHISVTCAGTGDGSSCVNCTTTITTKCPKTPAPLEALLAEDGFGTTSAPATSLSMPSIVRSASQTLLPTVTAERLVVTPLDRPSSAQVHHALFTTTFRPEDGASLAASGLQENGTTTTSTLMSGVYTSTFQPEFPDDWDNWWEGRQLQATTSAPNGSNGSNGSNNSNGSGQTVNSTTPLKIEEAKLPMETFMIIIGSVLGFLLFMGLCCMCMLKKYFQDHWVYGKEHHEVDGSICPACCKRKKKPKKIDPEDEIPMKGCCCWKKKDMVAIRKKKREALAEKAKHKRREDVKNASYKGVAKDTDPEVELEEIGLEEGDKPSKLDKAGSPAPDNTALPPVPEGDEGQLGNTRSAKGSELRSDTATSHDAGSGAKPAGKAKARARRSNSPTPGGAGEKRGSTASNRGGKAKARPKKKAGDE